MSWLEPKHGSRARRPRPSVALLLAAVTLAAVAVAAIILAGSSWAGSDGASTARANASWAPAPATHAGLRTLATAEGRRLVLHTASGGVTFWTGVDLGSTTPGHSPGELSVSRGTYRRWFQRMGRIGVRMLRIYTIHPPAMYEELRSYNLAHPRAPIYLIQGAYLPDESYVQSRNLYASGPTRAFTEELRAASAAVHGALRRPVMPGRASGRWTADVSRWVAAWVIGVEMDPHAILASDRLNASAPEYHGKFFSSRPDATATTSTERWLAARMDELAAAEAARGRSAPIAFVNWPTTDPLHHAHEPLPQEDLVGIDANHVRASSAWPGGTFASFHAYPYYPDFLRHEPSYLSYRLHGRVDPYAGYLADLAAHFRDMPLMITEVGVPSSIGSAHFGTNGRDQGNHSERQALAIDASLVHVVHDVGLTGALIFSWTDEWFKRTWNTEPRQSVVNSERRALWHDPLTNEQWFGLNAEDPVRAGARVLWRSSNGVRQLTVDHDASFVYLTVRLDRPPTAPIRVGFDVLPGGRPLPGGGSAGYDVAVVVNPTSHSATASIRGDIDPILLDGQKPRDVPHPAPDGWSIERLSLNRSFKLDGTLLPAEYQAVGELREGIWDVRSAHADSRSTWHVLGGVLSLRLPWSMLALADPSSHTGVIPRGGVPQAVSVNQIGLLVDAGGGARATGVIQWNGWQESRYTERLKPGIQPLGEAFAALSRPAR